MMMTFLYPGTGFSLSSSSSSNPSRSPTDPSIVRDARLVAIDRSNNPKNNSKTFHHKKPSLYDNKIGILQDMGFDVELATRALESCRVSSLYLKDVDNLDKNVMIE